jgi:hypothetical protein
MQEFLQKLIANDTKQTQFTKDEQFIQQGMAPILALSNRSLTLQKANLLEAAKLQNWKAKAQVLFSELNKNNVKFLVFKGFAFTFLLYENTHLRPYSDIDVIIDRADYEKVQETLVQLGFQQYPSRQGQFVSFQNSFFDAGSPQTVIDLHWQINNRIEFHKHFKMIEMYENAIELTYQDVIFKTLGYSDGFILGCFHYQAHRPNDRKHVWLYDLALLWHKMNPLEQEECLVKAKSTQQSHIVLSSLKLMNSCFANCFNLDLDSTQLESESTEYYVGARSRKITDIKTRLSHIKGLNKKLTFLAEYIFQKKDYIKSRYGLNSNFWVYFYYPRMWVEDIFKLFK